MFEIILDANLAGSPEPKNHQILNTSTESKIPELNFDFHAGKVKYFFLFVV